MRSFEYATSALLLVVLALGACARNSSDGQEHKRPDPFPQASSPSFATVLVDFSGSFAPLTQTDGVALREIAHAVAELAVREWQPPVTVVWRRIGTDSVKAAPLCEVVDYTGGMIGAASSADSFRKELAACSESTVLASQSPSNLERFTDLAGALTIASQNFASFQGRKALVVFSDMLDQIPTTAKPIDIKLHGEIVLLIHRPGTEERDSLRYLARISEWRQLLKASGAQAVTAMPAFSATRHSVSRALAADGSLSGTSVSLIISVRPEGDQERTMVNRAVKTVAAALSSRAAHWPAPVTSTWFVARNPGWRSEAFPPAVFTPRLVQKTGQLSTPDKLRVALEELGQAAVGRAQRGGDLGGTVSLVRHSVLDSGDSHLLILLSDLAQMPSSNEPGGRAVPRREAVVILYSSQSTAGGATFLDRLRAWQSYFRSTGASSVCALDVATLTRSSCTACLPESLGDPKR